MHWIAFKIKKCADDTKAYASVDSQFKEKETGDILGVLGRDPQALVISTKLLVFTRD